MPLRRSASLPLILAVLATVAGCDGALPDVAPRCLPPRAPDAAPAEALSPESVAATLLTDSPSHLLLRADASAAIVDADGLLFVLPASEKRPTKEALTAALAPLSAEVRAATWNRTAVVVWLGRGHGTHAEPTARAGWDPELRLDLVHDDLTDTGCLVRVATPPDPRHRLWPRDVARIAERAKAAEGKLLVALGHVAAPLPAAELALRRAQDGQRLFTLGIWAMRQRTVPIAAVVLIVPLLIFFWLSVGKDSIFSKPELATLERNGALVVPAPAGQRYRVITYGLLHNGLDHLMNNGLALYIGSLLLEPAIGAARTILVFVGGVLAAGAARLLSKRPCVMTGASGGTFALKGAALALVLLPAAWVPTLARADFLILLGVMLGMGLLLSFLPTISLLGHAAGAAAGALLAISGVVTLAHPPLDGGAESPLARVVTWTIALVALAVWMAAGLYARRREPPP